MTAPQPAVSNAGLGVVGEERSIELPGIRGEIGHLSTFTFCEGVFIQHESNHPSSDLSITRTGEAARRALRIRRRADIFERAVCPGRDVFGGDHKEVERLEASGLARSTTHGRNRLIEADPTSPVCREVRGLLLKTLGPEALLRSAFADIDGIEYAFIFGSWADPSQPSPADIDVLVVGDSDVGDLYDSASDVEKVIGRPVNVTIRSPAEWANAEGVFERAVKSGPRIDLL